MFELFGPLILRYLLGTLAVPLQLINWLARLWEVVPINSAP